jgi:hypothetical protein
MADIARVQPRLVTEVLLSVAIIVGALVFIAAFATGRLRFPDDPDSW